MRNGDVYVLVQWKIDEAAASCAATAIATT
jgi:hypothetical protein